MPVSHLMIIMDETIQEEGCDRTRKEVQGKSTDGTKIGEEKSQEGERRMKNSAAVIEGVKRNATTYVGDSIVRKTDARLNKGEDVLVCLPGAININTVHQHNTRQSGHLYSDRVKHDFAKRCIRFSVIDTVNKTDTSIISKICTHSIHGFTHYTKDGILQNYVYTCNINNCYVCDGI